MKVTAKIIIVLYFFTSGLLFGQNVTTVPEKIEFGNVLFNSPKTTKTLKIVNRGTSAVSISSFSIINNPSNLISSTIAIPLEIQQNSSSVIDITLTPNLVFKGRIESRLILRISGTTDTISVLITATLVESANKSLVALSISDDSVKVGENVKIPVIIKKFDRNGNNIKSFELALTYNSSILVPITETKAEEIRFGLRTSVFSGSVKEQYTEGDTLILLDFATAIGNAVASDLTINNIRFKNENEELPSESIIKNGKLFLTGIVYINDIPRLLTSLSDRYQIYPNNNPIISDFDLKIKYISEAKLQIYTIDGVLLRDLTSSLPLSSTVTELTIPISKSIFAGPGIYIIKLSGISETTCSLINVN